MSWVKSILYTVVLAIGSAILFYIGAALAIVFGENRPKRK